MIDLNYFLLHKTSLVTHLVRYFLFLWQVGLVTRHLTRLLLFLAWQSTVLPVLSSKCVKKHANPILRASNSYLPVVLVLKSNWSTFFFFCHTSLESSGGAVLSTWSSNTAASEYKCSVDYTYFFYTFCHCEMSVSTTNMRLKDIRPAPCEIEYKNMKFLITDRPTDQNIQTYIQVWIL